MNIDTLLAASSRPILVVGDVMLDRYVTGSAQRISPEAPVPVLAVSSEYCVPGGAANVAHNLRSLGAQVHLFGVTGDDDASTVLRRRLADASISDHGLVAEIGRQTTVKTRVVALNQQLVRIDHESKRSLARDSRKVLLQRILDAIEACSVVILSDYSKGVIDASLVAELREATRALGLPLLVDPKSLDFSQYRGADVVTPNRAELSASLGGRPLGEHAEVVDAARRLIAQHEIPRVLVTLGAEGMMFVTADKATHFPARTREVYDVSGAGDTVIATLAFARASGADWLEACQVANTAAGIVVGKFGTATVTLDELRGGSVAAPRAAGKLVSAARLIELLEERRARGATIVFTNGCFDVLHSGHIASLEAASEFGDVLVVGLNSDASVRRIKGPDRPINPLTDRATVLGALESVDFVCEFDDDTPLRLIEMIRPDVLTKGADYTIDEVVGAEFVRANGGRVELISLVKGRSTSQTIARFRREST